MFKRKTETSPEPTPVDPVDRFFDAITELNAAWEALPRDVSPWIDWKNRRLVVQTRYSSATTHSRQSLRNELEARQSPY